jgi:hypothetical protein
MRATNNARPEYRPRGAANQDVIPPDRRPIRRPPDRAQESAGKVARAAAALLDVVVAEGKYRIAGNAFLELADGLDQGRIARYAAALICLRMGERGHQPAQAEAELAVWGDLQRIFGWENLNHLEPAGAA